MSKLKSNIVYQTLYQVLNVCIPLVTAPYLSRVLGAEKLGVFSYYNSILGYFVLFALLGVANYGMRSIAQCQTKEEVSKTFWEIYLFQLISSTTVVFTYAFFSLFAPLTYKVILFIQIVYLIGQALNIGWLYFGLEEYRTTVIRSIVVRLLTAACIFILIKKQDDLYCYVAILSFGEFLSGLVLWLPVGKHLVRTKITRRGVLRHIKPNIALFIPILAMSVYHLMDKTMLGLFDEKKESGYYYNADKLLSIPTAAVTGFGNVFLTRITALSASSNHDEVRKTQDESIYFGLCLICAGMWGIATIAKEFVPMYFGTEYYPCIILAYFFCAIGIVKVISSHVRNSFLIPGEQDKVYIYSVICGVVANLFANYLLIKVYRLGALGATLGTLIAETVVMLAQILLMRGKEAKRHCVVGICKGTIYIAFGAVMFVSLYFIGNPTESNLWNMLIKVAIGATIYFAECVITWKIVPSVMPRILKETLHFKLKNKLERE